MESASERQVVESGENIGAVASDDHGVFELSGEEAIGGYRGPSIFEIAHLGCALVDHRFDGEDHARLQTAAGSGRAKVEHLGIFVKGAANAVATVLADYRVSPFFHKALDGVADIPQAIAGDGCLEAYFHCLTGGGDESHPLFVGLAGDHSDVHIAVIPGLFYGDIDGEDIPLTEHARTGDAMHHLVVDGDADAPGIGGPAGNLVSFGTCHCSLLADEFFGDLVEFESRDTGSYLFHDASHSFSGNAATGAYFVDLFVGF